MEALKPKIGAEAKARQAAAGPSTGRDATAKSPLCGAQGRDGKILSKGVDV